jgi:hypothetical protein
MEQRQSWETITQLVKKFPACLTFHNKLFFYGEELQPLAETPSCRTTPCRLSATAYSIYSQLPSTCGSCFLHQQLTLLNKKVKNQSNMKARKKRKKWSKMKTKYITIININISRLGWRLSMRFKRRRRLHFLMPFQFGTMYIIRVHLNLVC